MKGNYNWKTGVFWASYVMGYTWYMMLKPFHISPMQPRVSILKQAVQ